MCAAYLESVATLTNGGEKGKYFEGVGRALRYDIAHMHDQIYSNEP